MIDNKERKQRQLFEVEQITKFILSKKQGEMITHTELQQLTQYDLSNEIELYRFKGNIMPRVKNDLIEHGYILKSVKGRGYYILKSNQIQSYTYRNYIKKPLKQFIRAEKILNHTKVNNLNQEELIKHKLTYTLNEELINENTKIINKDKFKTLE